MTQPMSALEYEFLALSRHIRAAMGRSMRGDARLEESAYTLLNLLDVGGPMSIGELADILGSDVSTLNRQTAALMRSDLVERRSDDQGGIARRFYVTPYGRERLEADRDASQRALAETLNDWSSHDQEKLFRVLRSLNATIERRYPAPWPRP